jgi:hypothetical protein
MILAFLIAGVLIVILGLLARKPADTNRPGDLFEDAETVAIRRVLNGQITGSTSIADFVSEFGLEEPDFR